MQDPAVSLEKRDLTQDHFVAFSLALSPTGYLYLYEDEDQKNSAFTPSLEFSKIKSLFFIKSGQEDPLLGVLKLGMMAIETSLPSVFGFWQTFAKTFITEVRKRLWYEGDGLDPSLSISPPLEELTLLLEEAPFMKGGEYLTLEVMQTIWQELFKTLQKEVRSFGGKFQDYLAFYNPSWNKVGRVCFHLAENKADPHHPFAFLATYTVHLSDTSKVQHLPLGQALKEYSGQDKRSQLLSLLIPVQKAAEQSSFIKNLVDTKTMFQPQVWRIQEAYRFLKEIPIIEDSGIVVKVPNWWTPRNPLRPQVTIAIGNAASNAVGLNVLLDFNIEFSLSNGETLSAQDWQTLLNAKDPLVQLKGQWVTVDQNKMNQVLSHWKTIERHVKREGLTFSEGLRLLAAAPGHQGSDIAFDEVKEWSKLIEGPWLQGILGRLRHPTQQEGNQSLKRILEKTLKASLRVYQLAGVQWLWWLYNLKLGGCLADDMGLGKTIQILSLLLLVKDQQQSHLKDGQAKLKPNLLILPASLLENWQVEINRFAPSLTVWVVHASANSLKKSDLENKPISSDSSADPSNLDSLNPDSSNSTIPPLADIDLVITTYGNVYRLPWMSQVSWDIIILDEAQNIKTPTAKQTISIKNLNSQVRFILTGTPIENRLLDLWSLFDFVAPGLLGSRQSFSNYGKKALQQQKTPVVGKGIEAEKIEETEGGGEKRFYAAIRHLISPYILRRLKSDKSIISDLPDKTEINTYCFLSKRQATLYQKSVEELARRLDTEQPGDVKRRGLVLSYLTQLKQICNHPNQWLGHGVYDDQDSGKFIQLKELCQAVALKQEKVLIFTQFREIIPALHEMVKDVFKRSGLMLHGQTAIKERQKLVDAFQEDQGPPFFILSLKAGGTGLTLTKASHVIHFDRWWNPAVENQATDRAYRIGQKKNVLVHKFICRGTLEEKIDFLVHSKKELAHELLSQEKGPSFTELSNADLLNLISLDIHKALGES